MNLSRVQSIAFSGLSIVGTLVGALMASIAFQALILNPSYSETPSAVGKEIEECASDAGKFLSRMELHAALSEKAYIEALQELPFPTRKAVAKTCGGAANKDLIHRQLCYRNEILRTQLTRAADRMSVSIDELTRWSAIAEACDSTLGYEACHRLHQWQAADFLPTHSDDVKYAPKSKGLFEKHH